MSDHTVVYRAGPNSEASDKVAARLRAGGVEVLNEQPNILLVNATSHAVSQALGDVAGWSVSAETKTPPPTTREKALKLPE
ncbi:MAG TPA: hypothetical protein VGO01_15650 [Bradyrhizobium sp.]|jgi:hypothetical protein|nr:hypothetical protein [Bradyrhizobium sp.]